MRTRGNIFSAVALGCLGAAWLARAAVPGSGPAAGADDLSLGLPPVSLHVTRVTTEELSKALGKSVGASVWVMPVMREENINESRVTVDLDGRPFWEVMAAIDAQLGLMPASEGFYTRQAGLKKATRQGAFLIVPWGIMRGRTVYYQKGGEPVVPPELLRLSGLVAVDPRVRVVGWKALEVLEAKDDTGRSLVLREAAGAGRAGGGEYEPAQRHVWSFATELGLPAAEATEMARFKAHTTLLLATGEKTYEVADALAQRAPLELARQKVVIGPNPYVTRKEEGKIDFSIGVLRKDERAANDAGHVPLPLLLRLVNAQGEEKVKLEMDGGRKDQQYYSMPAAGSPYKLVVTEPTGFREMAVPIELKDLALP